MEYIAEILGGPQDGMIAASQSDVLETIELERPSQLYTRYLNPQPNPEAIAHRTVLWDYRPPDEPGRPAKWVRRP